MRQALISDIHSNLEALTVVLDDIRKQDVDNVICLGDVIGYGPNPKECLDALIDSRLCLMGNHEEAVLNVMNAQGFNQRASKAVLWTVAQFDMLGSDREANRRRWDFMGNLPRSFESNGVQLMHGSPLEPTRGYIYTTDVRNPTKMELIFSKVEHLVFVGHTHVPGVWLADLTYLSPQELGYEYTITANPTVINVGSVGQPRDLDPRACYVLFDGTTVVWRRLKYEVQTTADKIFAIEDLDNFLGERILEGR